MGRFYQSRDNRFLEDAIYTPPFEEMLKTLTAVNQGIDSVYIYKDKLRNSLQAQGLNIDKPYINKVINEYDNKIDEVSKVIAKNTLDYRKNLLRLKELDREITKEWTMGGISKVQGNLAARTEFEKKYREQAIKDKGYVLQEDVDIALNKFDKDFISKGGTDYNNIVGTYNQYNYEDLNKYFDLQKFVEDMADKYGEEITTRNWAYSNGKWIYKGSESTKEKPENTIREGVYSAIKNNQEAMAYYNQMKRLGKFSQQDLDKLFSSEADRAARKYGYKQYEYGNKDITYDPYHMEEIQQDNRIELEKLKHKHAKELQGLETLSSMPLTGEAEIHIDPETFKNTKQKVKSAKKVAEYYKQEYDKALKTGNQAKIQATYSEYMKALNSVNEINTIDANKDKEWRSHVSKVLTEYYSKERAKLPDKFEDLDPSNDLQRDIKAFKEETAYRKKYGSPNPNNKNNAFVQWMIGLGGLKNSYTIDDLGYHVQKFNMDRELKGNSETYTKNRKTDSSKYLNGPQKALNESYEKFEKNFVTTQTNRLAGSTTTIKLADWNDPETKNSNTILARNALSTADRVIVNNGKTNVEMTINGHNKALSIQELKRLMGTEDLNQIFIPHGGVRSEGNVLKYYGNFTKKALTYLKGVKYGQNVELTVANTNAGNILNENLIESGNSDMSMVQLQNDPEKLSLLNKINSIGDNGTLPISIHSYGNLYTYTTIAEKHGDTKVYTLYKKRGLLSEEDIAKKNFGEDVPSAKDEFGNEIELVSSNNIAHFLRLLQLKDKK